jgi:hypothetical protein
MTTPSIEQVVLPEIPWLTVQSAIKVAFGDDAANWKINLVEAEDMMPEHLTIIPATNSPNAKGKVKPTFLVFADHIPQPSGFPRLLYFVWAPRKALNRQVVDLSHVLLGVMPHFCDVAEAIALHWAAREVGRRLQVEFSEPDFSDTGFDIGDSAFDSTEECTGNPDETGTGLWEIAVDAATSPIKGDDNLGTVPTDNNDGFTDVNLGRLS